MFGFKIGFWDYATFASLAIIEGDPASSRQDRAGSVAGV